MEKITIFTASSQDAFTQEQTRISAFIQRLNNCYIDKGLFFSLVTREYIESSASLGNAPGDSSSLLSEARLALFLFGSEIAADTLDGLDLALDMHKKNGIPQIAVFFKKSTGCEGGGVQRLKDRLAFETDVFSNVYGHIDTLLLGLMMHIKQMKLPGMDVRLENGRVWQGGEALLSFEHAEIVTGYDELQRLKLERAGLESRYYAAKSKYAEAPDDNNVFDEFREAARLRNESNRTITDIESQLYSMLDAMFEQTAKGTLSKRQIEGYRHIESGNLNAARQILDIEEILSDARRDEAFATETSKRAQVSVNELMQLKDVNATVQDWDGVDACYREATRLEEKHSLPRRVALEYVWYLYGQIQFDKAAELGGSLVRYIDAVRASKAPVLADEEISKLYHRLGAVYLCMERIDDAEKMCNAAMEIRKARISGEPDAISWDIAATYNNLGIIYQKTGRYESTIEAYKAALDIRKELAQRNPDKYDAYLTHSYNNLGDLYLEMGRYEEAAQNLAASRLIIDKLISVNKDEELLRVSSINSNLLGNVYECMGRSDEAEEQYNAALNTLLLLADANLEAYEPRIANIYHCLGQLFTKMQRYAEAEVKLKTAMTVFKRYTEYSDAIEEDVAGVYFDMGILFRETKRYAEAENALFYAIRILEKYIDANAIFADKIDEAKKLLNDMNEERNCVNQDMIEAGLTQTEINVARLLLNGESRSYITRYLRISAAEYNTLEKSIRRKMNAAGSKDVVVAAVAETYKLTSREADMLRYLSRSTGNDVIAAELHLSDATVRRHVRNLLDKLSINGRQDVAEWLKNYKG